MSTVLVFCGLWLRIAREALGERLRGCRLEFVYQGRQTSMTKMCWLAAKAATETRP